MRSLFYWWRGVAADTSSLFLKTSVLMFFILPRGNKSLGGIAINLEIITIFLNSKVILQPISL